MAKKKVLLFSDFGVDDIVAALYAYYSEEIEIVGVVADYGNVSKRDAIRNVKFIQEKTGISDIPVFGGAFSPLTGIPPVYYTNVHGPAGLGSIIPENYHDHMDLENFYEVTSLIDEYKDEIIIYSAGRLTSLATLFVLYPEKIKEIKEFYLMGGAFQSPGNVTPVAEANFYSDPYAANLVLQLSPKQIHIVPLDVTRYAILTPQMIDQLNDYYTEAKDEAGMLIKPMVDYYYDFYKKSQPDILGAPLHDLLAMWTITQDPSVQFKEVPVKVSVNSGSTFGQSSGDFRESSPKAAWPIHKVALSFNYKTFVEQIFATLTSGPSRG
ncbi:nucleoside hydrolase [Falsibacillus albus]|uniref:Nucleoside hydrolase n=1 Tax=Falsibacillus albus TaxID=2478915 RepID=A0A3L7JWT0_9BACI|nr:nucleoside hydrolase [Falsibacillus albus]RLQ95183.1 nucleoside hydrolase [Falsibacillus albus]